MKKVIVPLPTPQQQFPITPEAFWREFSGALRTRWPEIGKAFEQDTVWTASIIDLLKDVVKGFECHPYCEYWPRVDVSGFDHPCGEWEEWSWEIAIEHEGSGDWREELCKPININAGLKVLIAYTGEEIFKEVLERLPAIYRSRKYVTTPCNFLFIFGPGDLEDFVAFKFDGKAVVEITGGVRIVSEPQH